MSDAAQGHDWRTDITMPDDETQTLADVLDAMRSNHLQRQAAFVEWLAGEWYDAKADLQSRDMGRGDMMPEFERGELRMQLQETRRILLASITLADLWTAVDDLGIDAATVEFHDGYAMVVRPPRRDVVDV